MAKTIKGKRSGFGLEIKTFQGHSGRTYIVFKLPTWAFHTFVETEAKEAHETADPQRVKQTPASIGRKYGIRRRRWGDVKSLLLLGLGYQRPIWTTTPAVALR
jgi:hypothetical protein